jgi:two-component system, NarL family, nitrate/nitrite response regulator NarL
LADLSWGRTAVLLHQYPLRLVAIERALREDQIAVVGKTGRPDEALDLVARHEPDFVILELEETEPAGPLGLLERLRERSPSSQLIAFCASPVEETIDAAFGAGAVAVIVDTADRDQLAASVRQAVAWALAQEVALTHSQYAG